MNGTLELAKLERDIRDDLSLDITELRPIVERPAGSCVYAGRLHEREVVVRLPGGRATLTHEVWAYRQHERLGLPVPHVLAYRECPPTIGRPTLVMTRLRGEPLGTVTAGTVSQPSAAGKAMYRQLGRAMRTMHEVTVAGFGYLRIDGESVAGQDCTWQAFLHRRPFESVTRYLAGHHLIDREEEELLDRTLESLKDTRLDRAVFLHADLQGANVLIEDGRIAGIIDPANGFAGDPRFDVAFAFMEQVAWQRQAFARGYGGAAADPLVMRYLVWVAARKLAWRHQTGDDAAMEPARRVLAEALREV